MEKFIPNRIALITLLSACFVILVSMGLRQTFGLFFSAFEKDLNCTRTEFGLAIGIQMLFWGFFAPLFGIIVKFSSCGWIVTELTYWVFEETNTNTTMSMDKNW